LIITPLWKAELPDEAVAINVNAFARLLADRARVRPVIFAKATLSRQVQTFQRDGASIIAVNRDLPARVIKLVGWLTTSYVSPHRILLMNRHALTLLPRRVVGRRSDVITAYLGESRLSPDEAQVLGVLDRVYIEDPDLKAMLPNASLRPMGADLSRFTFSHPPAGPPWRVCFASSPLPWHESEELESRYLRGRGVLDLLQLVEAMQQHLSVELTLVWRKDPALIHRLTDRFPNVCVKTGTIADMNRFLDDFHFCAAMFRPDEKATYKPFPNSVLEAMAKGLIPLAYADTVIGERIGSVIPDFLLSTKRSLSEQARLLGRRLPDIYRSKYRKAVRRSARSLDMAHFVSRFLGEG
jgi:hypothetical protein